MVLGLWWWWLMMLYCGWLTGHSLGPPQRRQWAVKSTCFGRFWVWWASSVQTATWWQCTKTLVFLAAGMRSGSSDATYRHLPILRCPSGTLPVAEFSLTNQTRCFLGTRPSHSSLPVSASSHWLTDTPLVHINRKCIMAFCQDPVLMGFDLISLMLSVNNIWLIIREWCQSVMSGVIRWGS